MSYSAIDLAGMGTLVDRLSRASESLHTVATDLRGKASRESVSTTATWRIASVASWVDDELPMLRRRLELARAADAMRSTALRGNTVYLSEPVMSKAEAEERARELAAVLEGIDRTDEESAQELHDLAIELQEIQGDPDAMSAFWAAAGPYWAEMMPSFLVATGSETAASDLRIFSQSFTTALHDTDPPPEFTEIVDQFTTAPEGGPAMGWNRLAMIQEGAPPTDVLVEIVEVNALNYFNEDDLGRYDPRNLHDSRNLDLPSDAFALAFSALANDPAAVRRAIPSSQAGDMTDLVMGYARSVGSGDEVADAFGEAVVSGAGVHDEEMGEHSGSASRFALEVIVASAQHDEVPWVLKDSFGELAASYAPELLAGANIDDAAGRESGVGRPDGWSAFVGLDPAFYLSPEDTHGFLRTFGDTDELSTPFDEAAGELYEDLLGQAARHDAENGGGTEMTRTATLFGNLAGLQYLAQREERREADEFDQAVRDAMAKVFSFGVGKVPTPQGQLAGYAWKGGKWLLGKVVSEWQKGDPESTREALLDDATLQAAFLQDYQMYSILAENVPAHAENLPEELRAADGGLLPPDEIVGDEERFAQFSEWLDSQDADFTEGTTDRIVDGASTGFSGGFQDAQTRFGEN